MNKFAILFVIAIGFCSVTMAQQKDVKTDQKELKNTIKDKKEDKKDVRKDLTHLKVKAAVNKQKEVKYHRKNIHKQDEHLENHGVKHPSRKAKKQLKKEKEIKNG